MQRRKALALLISVSVPIALICSGCGSTDTGKSEEPTVFPGPRLSTPTVKVMSYNTDHVGYYAGSSKVHAYGQKMRDVGAAVVGVQECQDRESLASASGYKVVPGTGAHNPIFYDPAQVMLVANSGGNPRHMGTHVHDPQHTVSWAQFNVAGDEFWLFNLHLLHARGEKPPFDHTGIADFILQTRRELGAESMPTVITGSGLEATFDIVQNGGFKISYEAQGKGGQASHDKIFASWHWSSANGEDEGGGGSDHSAMAVDLTLKAADGAAVDDAHAASAPVAKDPHEFQAEAAADGEAKSAAEDKIAEAGSKAQRPGESQFQWAKRLREQEAIEAAAGAVKPKAKADELDALTPAAAKARKQALKNAEDAKASEEKQLLARQEALQKNSVFRDGQRGREAAEQQREASLKKEADARKGKVAELAAIMPAVGQAREKAKRNAEIAEEERLAKQRERFEELQKQPDFRNREADRLAAEAQSKKKTLLEEAVARHEAKKASPERKAKAEEPEEATISV